jgi:hypothetical protein
MVSQRDILTQIKAGDWVRGDCPHWSKIVTVIREDKESPIYGLTDPHDNEIVWFTLNELVDSKMRVGEPDFSIADKVKTGDIISIGCPTHDPNGTYVKVLVRLDKAILLSEAPDQKALKLMETIRHFESHGTETVFNEGGREALQQAVSTNKAMGRAGHWITTDFFTLMGWSLVKEIN